MGQTTSKRCDGQGDSGNIGNELSDPNNNNGISSTAMTVEEENTAAEETAQIHKKKNKKKKKKKKKKKSSNQNQLTIDTQRQVETNTTVYTPTTSGVDEVSQQNPRDFMLHNESPSENSVTTQGTLPTASFSEHSYAFPAATSSNLSTPQNAGIGSSSSSDQEKATSYEHLGLSPGKSFSSAPLSETGQPGEASNVRTFQETMDAIADDGILEETEIVHSADTYRALVFLYSRKYFIQSTKEERIEEIRKLFENEKAFRRLCGTAFPNHDEMKFRESEEEDEEAFDEYFAMADTARIIFSWKGSKGGFYGDAILRKQTSGNCFLVCAAAYVTVKRRFDKCRLEAAADSNGLTAHQDSDAPSHPLDAVDATWLCRNYYCKDTERLTKRMVQNKGASSLKLVMEITRVKDGPKWRCNEAADGPESFGARIANDFGFHGPGLVCNFTIKPLFQRQGHGKGRRGYKLFGKNHVDDKGIFVRVEGDDKSEDYRQELKKIWDAQREDAVKKKRDLQANIDRFIPEKYRSNPTAFSPEPESKEDTNDSSKRNIQHAMVLLGIIKREDASGVEKDFFVLWNWWRGMPLVVVSPEYLQTGSPSVWFLSKNVMDMGKLPSDAMNGSLNAECCCPDDGEEEEEDEAVPWEVEDFGIENS